MVSTVRAWNRICVIRMIYLVIVEPDLQAGCSTNGLTGPRLPFPSRGGAMKQSPCRFGSGSISFSPPFQGGVGGGDFFVEFNPTQPPLGKGRSKLTHYRLFLPSRLPLLPVLFPRPRSNLPNSSITAMPIPYTQRDLFNPFIKIDHQILMRSISGSQSLSPCFTPKAS